MRERGDDLRDATFPSSNPALYQVLRASLPIVGHHQLGSLQQQVQKEGFPIMLAANCARLAEVEAATHAESRWHGYHLPCMRKPSCRHLIVRPSLVCVTAGNAVYGAPSLHCYAMPIRFSLLFSFSIYTIPQLATGLKPSSTSKHTECCNTQYSIFPLVLLL